MANSNYINLINIEILQKFYDDFAIYKASKENYKKDILENKKSINYNYSNENLLARAEDDENYYFLVYKKNEKNISNCRIFIKIKRKEKMPHSGVLLQLLINSHLFLKQCQISDDLKVFPTVDGHYLVAKIEKNKMGHDFTTQRMRVYPQTKHNIATLYPEVTSFRDCKERNQSKNNNPRALFSETGYLFEDFKISETSRKYKKIYYFGRYQQGTKGFVPHIWGDDNISFWEAKNHFYQFTLEILQNKTFNQLVYVNIPELKKEQVGNKNIPKKEKLLKTLKKFGAFHFTFIDARSDNVNFFVVDRLKKFLTEQGLEFKTYGDISKIKIENEKTIKESINQLINTLPPNVFPIIFADEPPEKIDVFDPKKVIDKILYDLPHHSIVNIEILQKESTDDKKEKAPEIVTILANLLIKKEVTESKLLVERNWFKKGDMYPSFIKYIFCSCENYGNSYIYSAIDIEKNGKLNFYEAIDKNDFLEKIPNKKQVWLSKKFENSNIYPSKEMLIIEDTHIRVIIPDDRQKHTEILTGCHILPEIKAYEVGMTERPSGKTKKSSKSNTTITTGEIINTHAIRKVKNASDEELKDILSFCLDGSVRLNRATAIPVFYKYLREWEKLNNIFANKDSFSQNETENTDV